MLLFKGIIATCWIPTAIIALHCFVLICHSYVTVIPEVFKPGCFQEAGFILVGCIFCDKMLIGQQRISCVVLRLLKRKKLRKRRKNMNENESRIEWKNDIKEKGRLQEIVSFREKEFGDANHAEVSALDADRMMRILMSIFLGVILILLKLILNFFSVSS